jgi:AraC family transcriptional regulator
MGLTSQTGELDQGLHITSWDALKCALSRGSIRGRPMSTTKYSATPAEGADSPRSNPRTRRETLATLIEAASAAPDNDRDTARACIAEAAALLNTSAARSRRRDEDPEMQRGGLAPWQARRVADYVGDHLGTRIRTSDLAAVAQLSASHFTRAFKETFGETPLGYVSRQRMRYAQDLMLRSGECLSQIALTCGHCDQSHFTRVFRRRVGMSPRAWRRQFANLPQPRVHNSEGTLPNR